ncbi:MAG: chemotaxis response regulator protein-glutamate methylesterase [Candidatus Raymondbacteria bacterium RifOxyB12_full_50_8]|nr:MAG: chemotaxis response regulator protein-glutamate methylesterase [Candidatus Raymondbacteria bacterium RifOxyB12_full_50_8]
MTYILTSDPAIQVVGTANNGMEALEILKMHKPDVITMDIHMPMMDGFEATRRIMETIPTPIVIVSGSIGASELPSTFRAIEAGALALVRRPAGIDHSAFEAASRELIQTVKLMSEIKVVRRLARSSKVRMAAPVSGQLSPQRTGTIRAIAIGASTGGPPVLQKILSGLAPGFPVPVLIVQHIAQGFVQGLAEWLSSLSGFPVSVASHSQPILPGHAYLAPDGFHLGLERGLRISLSSLPPENGLRPSVSYLFRSVAQVLGQAAIGVLLTGMGRDGAEELKIMKERGALTIVQDEESCIVYGMPGEAVKLDAAMYVLSPEGIAAMLAELVKK